MKTHTDLPNLPRSYACTFRHAAASDPRNLGDTWNQGRERPRTARWPRRGAIHGVVHVLGSVCALIGTVAGAAQNAAPSATRQASATSCTQNALSATPCGNIIGIVR